MPRQRSPRRRSRSPRHQRDRRHRSSSSRSRSRSRSRGRSNRSPAVTKYKERAQHYSSRDSPPVKVRRASRRSPTPPPTTKPRQRHRSRSYSPAPRDTQARSFDRRESPEYSPQQADYSYKSESHGNSQMPTYTVVNRDRSYSPDGRRTGNSRSNYDDRHADEPRDLDARLREMEARSPELTKPRVYVKDNYSPSRNSSRDNFTEKSRRRDEQSPERYQDEKQRSRDYQESSSRGKESYSNSNSYQADPPRRQSREQRRQESPVHERRRSSKEAKYTSPDRYRSPEPERSKYRKTESKQESSSHRSRRDDHDGEKYREKKDTGHKSDRSSRHSNSNHHGSSGRDAGVNSQKGHHSSSRQESSSSKTRQDREEERRQPAFDPSLVIVPRRKDEGRGGIFNRPEITMRSITDDPDNQQFEEKRVVAVLPGKKLPAEPAFSDNELRRDYMELLARKGLTSGGFEVGRDKYGDLGLSAPQTLSSRFQGASSLDFLTTLENLEMNRAKNLERELELRREMEILRDRSPLRLSNSTSELEQRLNMIERKVEPKNPRDLRHDLESRRKQLKKSERVVSPRRSVAKKSDKDSSKLRMTSSDRRPVRERLGMSPGKKSTTRRSGSARREEPAELPDFKKEVEEIQKAEWLADPESVPKGIGYFEHDDRERGASFASTSPRGRGFRGRGTGYVRGRFNTRGRGFFRGSTYRGSSFRGSTYRGSTYRGSSFRGTRGGFRGRGTTIRGIGQRHSPSWKHDKFETEAKKKETGESGGKEPVKRSRDSSNSRADKHTSTNRKDDRKPRDSREGKRVEKSRTTSSHSSRPRESRDSRKERR